MMRPRENVRRVERSGERERLIRGSPCVVQAPFEDVGRTQRREDVRAQLVGQERVG